MREEGRKGEREVMFIVHKSQSTQMVQLTQITNFHLIPGEVAQFVPFAICEQLCHLRFVNNAPSFLLPHRRCDFVEATPYVVR